MTKNLSSFSRYKSIQTFTVKEDKKGYLKVKDIGCTQPKRVKPANQKASISSTRQLETD